MNIREFRDKNATRKTDCRDGASQQPIARKSWLGPKFSLPSDQDLPAERLPNVSLLTPFFSVVPRTRLLRRVTSVLTILLHVAVSKFRSVCKPLFYSPVIVTEYLQQEHGHILNSQ